MPIRVNLKEIFPTDPQEIAVAKLNFNYNKLLELGVGSPGPIGITGPQGAAGPIGLTGPQGGRGATWWVDSGDPALVIFSEPLVDGDMYLDQTSTVIQIYQYDESTTTWNPVVGIADIVNNYLSTQSPSPFESVLVPYDKFIVFKNRDDSTDLVRGISNASTNNILFLNNFDETLVALDLKQYNSLLGIFANHYASSVDEVGRYHFEMGSLFNDSGTPTISELKHNLKGKFYKKNLSSTAYLSSTNTWINTAKFSLSIPESVAPTQIDENGEFDFRLPKYNNEGALPIREEISIKFGSAESHVENGVDFQHIIADGITISETDFVNNLIFNTTLGLVLNYSSPINKLDAKNHIMLDANPGVDGVFLVNKGLYVNEDANIIDGLAIGSGFADSTAPANSLVVEGQLGIGTDSPGILVPGSKVNLHNFLTGSGTLNLVNLNEISSIVFTGIKNLWINTNLLNNVTGIPTVELNRTLISNSQLSSLYLNRIELDTITAATLYGSQISFNNINSITNFYGSHVSFGSLIAGGLTTISGNFYGSRINIPTGAVDFTGSNKEIFGSQFILGENDFTGSSATVIGSKILLSPHHSNLATSSLSILRGSNIDLFNYLPASNTEVRGSSITIAPLPPTSSSRPMGDIFGQNIDIRSNMLVANSSEIYGMNIQINTGGLTLPNNSYGVKVNLGNGLSNLPSTGITYGVHVTTPSTDPSLNPNQRAYGLYIDADHNYIKGGTQIVNDATESPDSFAIAPGASSGTVVETIASVNYDRVLYFTTDPFFNGQRLTAGFLTVTIEIDTTQIYYGLAQGSSDLEPSITGAANCIQNYSTLIPAGESVTIEFIRGGGFTLAGTGNITYRWHLRKLGRDSSPV
jgi:hypothetical protein